MFDLDSYCENGFYIIKNIISSKVIDEYVDVYKKNIHLWKNDMYPRWLRLSIL